jgi:hypothetical protein
MTKLERAIKEAEQLPSDMREQLGEKLPHYIHKYLALRDDIDIGLRELDADEGRDGKDVFAVLKSTCVLRS